MNDRYKFHEFYKGKENELEYKIVQLPTYNNINSENIIIAGLSPAIIKKGSEKERKLLNEWDEIFKTIGNVKRLKISVFNQEILDSLHKIPNLSELIIEGSNFVDISPLKKIKNLSRLEINYNSKLTD
ncbi:MAG TPA: hypothetical protein VL859_09445, partial [Flavobacterium sp.]|nr:hypothetical protein [Flavobacterium sp.]